MFKLLIVLLATVAYASAGAVADYDGLGGYGLTAYSSGYGYGYGGLGHNTAVYGHLPPVQYIHAPPATSYANTYKVAYAAPAITKVVAPITKLAYTAPAISYSSPLSYGHGGYGGYGSYGGYGGYGSYGYAPSVSYYGNGLGYSGLGHGYSGYSGYSGLGYGYGHGGYLH